MNSEAASLCFGKMKALPSLNSFETISYCELPALWRLMRNLKLISGCEWAWVFYAWQLVGSLDADRKNRGQVMFA